MTIIQWADIEAECGDYRAGFVATFRKYEGMATDERDAQGRTVKVTATSFARHIGVNDDTFRRWIRREQDPRAEDLAPPRSKRDLTRDVLRAARHEPDAVVEGIMQAPERVQDEIFHEVKMRRAEIDRSPATRKAAEARVDEMLEPTSKALRKMASGIIGMAETIEECADDLQRGIADGVDYTDDLPRLREATDRWVLAVERAAMMSEARR